jgi:hypothetical protein
MEHTWNQNANQRWFKLFTYFAMGAVLAGFSSVGSRTAHAQATWVDTLSSSRSTG